MTLDRAIFTSKFTISNSPVIHNINGSLITINYIDHVSILNLSLPNTFFIPKLTLNLLFVDQLCELGFNVIFTPSGCSMQDPKADKHLG